jgi:hypothetical protein
MRTGKILVGLSALGCASILNAEQPVVVYFSGTAVDAATSLANMCVQRGIPVVEQDGRKVVCASEMNGTSGLFAGLLYGNRYSTTPVAYSRFTVIEGKGFVTVQASQWIEVQMAFGQVRRHPADGKKQRAKLEGALLQAGGSRTPPNLPLSATAPSPSAVVAPVGQAPSAPVSVTEAKPATQPSKQPAQFGNGKIRCLTCN